MGYDQERYHTKIPVIYPLEIDCNGSPADQIQIDFVRSIAVHNWGICVSTTFNSSVSSVLALKDSDGTERATLTIATGTAAKTTELTSDTDYSTPAVFSDGLVTINLKTAATTAGKGYVILFVSEDYTGTTATAA